MSTNCMQKENKQKKIRIFSKIRRISWQQQIQKIKTFQYYAEEDKTFLNRIFIVSAALVQDPTFNSKLHSLELPCKAPIIYIPAGYVFNYSIV